jgi:hypothetical protein
MPPKYPPYPSPWYADDSTGGISTDGISTDGISTGCISTGDYSTGGIDMKNQENVDDQSHVLHGSTTSPATFAKDALTITSRDAVLCNRELLMHILQKATAEYLRPQITVLVQQLDKLDVKPPSSTEILLDGQLNEKNEAAMVGKAMCLMMVSKAVCQFWLRCCRAALTDMDWHKEYREHELWEYTIWHMAIVVDEPDQKYSEYTTWRLPLDCTLHPSASPKVRSSEPFYRDPHYHDSYCGEGYISGPKVAAWPGNPSVSVKGTLHDLFVRCESTGWSNDYVKLHQFIIVEMDLEVDGIHYDAVWSPLASKFTIRRNNLLHFPSHPRVTDTTTELDFITIGRVVQNSYWFPLGNLLETMKQVANFYRAYPGWVPSELRQWRPWDEARRPREKGPGLLRANGQPCIEFV